MTNLVIPVVRSSLKAQFLQLSHGGLFACGPGTERGATAIPSVKRIRIMDRVKFLERFVGRGCTPAQKKSGRLRDRS